MRFILVLLLLLIGPAHAQWTNRANGAGTGASPVPSVVDFGADPTGVADSCATAIPDAIAAAGASVVLYFPAGSYKCSSAISIVNKPVRIKGDGMYSTTIKWGTTNAGISISQDAFEKGVIFENITLQTEVAQPTASGISIAYPASAGASLPGVRMDNVHVRGDGAQTTGYWRNGVRCVNCVAPSFDHVWITGRYESAGTWATGVSAANMDAGFKFTGYTIAANLAHSSVNFGRYGLYASGDSERANITQSNLVAVNYGVYYDDKDTSGDATGFPWAPGPSITASHCAAFSSCVVIKGWANSTISGNLFYLREESTLYGISVHLADGLYGGAAAGTAFSIVADNGFNGRGAAAAQPSFAATLGPAAFENKITDNFTFGQDYFINEATTSARNVIENNWSRPGAGGGALGIRQAWYLNNAPSNVRRHNYPQVIGNVPATTFTLPANCAACSVGEAPSEIVVTANTAATTITALTNGKPEQRVTLFAGDANTTLQHNAAISLRGATNFAMPAGANVTLVNDGVVWREVARTQ